MATPLLLKIIAGLLHLIQAGKTLHEFDPGKGLYLAARDRLIHLLARWTGTLPRIVVIDDLDRARVEQQRAFLRALLRYARQMGFALLVCMDERELLAAPAVPESPEELLRKVIQFELRLPERGAEDVLWLARSCCRQLAGQNDGHWPRLLNDPRWLANLLRCLLLLGPPADCSPRQVKRLLNDLLLRAEQLQLRTADDCCALLRLECLYRLSPELRRQGDRLLPALESNRRSDFACVLRDAGIAAAQQEALGRFFARTRMMQPAVRDGWFRLLGALPAPAGDETAAVPEDVRLPGSAFGARGHELLRLYLGNLTYLAQGYAATLELQADAEFAAGGSAALPASPATGEAQAQAIWKFPVPGGSDEKFSPEELGEFFCQPLSFFWPLLIAALTPADARQRARLYRAAAAWLRGQQERAQALPHPAQEERLGVIQWLETLYQREHLADAEVWQLTPLDARRRTMAACGRGENPLALLMLIELLPDDAAAVLPALAESRAFDARKVAHWLAGLPGGQLFDAAIQPTGEPSRPASPRPGPETWRRICPPPALSDDGDDLFTELSVVARHGPTLSGDLHLPETYLVLWQCGFADRLSLAECLRLLKQVAERDDPARWSLPALEGWLRPPAAQARLPLSGACLPLALQAVHSAGRLQWPRDALSPPLQMMALAVAVVLGWRLPESLPPAFDPVPPKLLYRLLESLFEFEYRPSADCGRHWLRVSETAFAAGLLTRVQGFAGLTEKTQRRWQQISRHVLSRHVLGPQADALFAAIPWPPRLAACGELSRAVDAGRLCDRPGKDYLDALSSVAAIGGDYVAMAVDELIALAAQAKECRQRNRMLFDAWRLAQGQWDESALPDLFDPAIFRAAAGVASPALREALTQAAQSTWPTFAGFQAHSADWQFAPQDSDAAAADWFRFYRAYFVQGIETMTDADAEIARRAGRAANAASAAEDGWLQTVVACDELSRWQDQVWDDARAVFALWDAQSAVSADASPEI